MYLCKMKNIRQKKASRLLEKELSDIFRQDSPRILGTIMISVTKVRISSDFSVAKVFLSLFPNTNSEELIENIKSKQSHFRNLLAKRIRNQLRIIPELYFYLDDSADYADEIDRLLKK